MRNTRQSEAASVVARVFSKRTYAVTANVPIVGISEAPGVNIAYSRTQISECAIRDSPRAHPARLRPPSVKHGSDCPVVEPTAGIMDHALRKSPIRGPFLRMRNTRQSDTASDATRVRKHQVDVHSDGGKRYFAYIRRPGGLLAFSGAHFANTQCDAVNRRILRYSGFRIGLLVVRERE